MSLHTVRSLCHKDFCVIFSLVVLPYFRPFVGRFVGNPFSHSSPKPHPLRRSITIPPNTSSKYTYFCQMIYLSLSFKIIKHCPDRQGIFVSFLILSSSALLFTRRRLFSEERSAAFVFCKWSMNQSSAISSTSTRTFLGSPFTAKQERAGFPTKYFAYTSLKAAKSVISLK